MEQSRTYRIGEIARQTGVSVATLRYYESRRLLSAPPRTRSGYRLYSAGAVDQVKFIKQAQSLGLTLDDVQQLVMRCQRARGTASCRKVHELLTHRIDDIDARLEEMLAFRRTLKEHLTACEQALAAATNPECPTLDALDGSKRTSGPYAAR